MREIIDGKHDDIPERAFLLKGTIEQVIEDARGAREKDEADANRGGDSGGSGSGEGGSAGDNGGDEG